MEMTGKSQAEAVSVLRNTKLGSVVKIVVSRQVAEEEDQFTVPRELVCRHSFVIVNYVVSVLLRMYILDSNIKSVETLRIS